MAIDTSNLRVTKLVLEIGEPTSKPVKAKTKASALVTTPAPVKTEAETPALVITPAPVKTEAETPPALVITPAPVKAEAETPAPEITPAPVKTEAGDLLRVIVPILLGLLGLLLIIALALFLFSKLAPPRNTVESAPASAPIVNSVPALPNNDVWNAVLTSANSNGNFIGDMGGKGNGSIIPTEAVDLAGKTWKVGRALLTYCETASTCYYMFAKPNDVMPRAFNVNLYTPEFTGDLVKELPYINTGWNNNSDVSWTYWNNN